MKSLHYLATKLQDYIIRSQQDAYNQTNMNIARYNNLTLKMTTKLRYPHVIVCMGISEAVFNIEDGTKMDGSLGVDEKYVKNWLERKISTDDLRKIYLTINSIDKPEEDDDAKGTEVNKNKKQEKQEKKKTLILEGKARAIRLKKKDMHVLNKRKVNKPDGNKIPADSMQQPAEGDIPENEDVLLIDEEFPSDHMEVLEEDENASETIEDVKKEA